MIRTTVLGAADFAVLATVLAGVVPGMALDLASSASEFLL